jgi:hypothetical protein
MEISNCKNCNSDLIFDSIELIQSIDWSEEKEMGVKLCHDCGCMHFELDGYEVTEFKTKDIINTFDSAAYTKSDYDTAIENKK